MHHYSIYKPPHSKVLPQRISDSAEHCASNKTRLQPPVNQVHLMHRVRLPKLKNLTNPTLVFVVNFRHSFWQPAHCRHHSVALHILKDTTLWKVCGCINWVFLPWNVLQSASRVATDKKWEEMGRKNCIEESNFPIKHPQITFCVPSHGLAKSVY